MGQVLRQWCEIFYFGLLPGLADSMRFIERTIHSFTDENACFLHPVGLQENGAG